LFSAAGAFRHASDGGEGAGVLGHFPLGLVDLAGPQCIRPAGAGERSGLEKNSIVESSILLQHDVGQGLDDHLHTVLSVA